MQKQRPLSSTSYPELNSLATVLKIRGGRLFRHPTSVDGHAKHDRKRLALKITHATLYSGVLDKFEHGGRGFIFWFYMVQSVEIFEHQSTEK